MEIFIFLVFLIKFERLAIFLTLSNSFPILLFHSVLGIFAISFPNIWWCMGVKSYSYTPPPPLVWKYVGKMVPPFPFSRIMPEFYYSANINKSIKNDKAKSLNGLYWVSWFLTVFPILQIVIKFIICQEAFSNSILFDRFISIFFWTREIVCLISSFNEIISGMVDS